MDYRQRLLELGDELNTHVTITSEPELLVSDVGESKRDMLLPEEIERGFVTGGHSDPGARAILLNGWAPGAEAQVYLAGLHELGHVETSPASHDDLGLHPFELMLWRLGIGDTPEPIKHYEIKAWEWAIKHLTPDLLDLALRYSGRALRTYGVDDGRIAALHAKMQDAVSRRHATATV